MQKLLTLQKKPKEIMLQNVTKENIKEHNPNWSQVPDHPYRILIISGTGSGKANALLYLLIQ